VDECRTRLLVTGDLVFTRSCWIQSKIEAETWNGLENYFKAMEIAVEIFGPVCQTNAQTAVFKC
jgi:hypothetical protein